ncbi:MAG: Eco57I restriction-modification methylase domain-containing protein [Promethearchaeota archaeon]
MERQNLLGAYYTEKYIAKIIVHHTLQYWFFGNLLQDENLLNLSRDQRNKIKIKLEKTKILDPAVGSGVFLIESAKYLEKIYRIILPKKIDQKERRLSIVQNHLFGWDIKNLAVETTKNELSKWILGKKPSYYKSYFDLDENLSKKQIKTQKNKNNLPNTEFISKISNNFSVKNALEHELDTKSYERAVSFSIIIGNPPFGNILTEDQRTQIENSYECRKTEIAELFVELGLKILSKNKNEGILSFILPKTVTYYQKWMKCRNLIINNHILEIDDLGIAFPNVNLEQITIFLRTTPNINQNLNFKQNISIGSFFSYKILPKNNFKIQGKIPYNLIRKYKTLIFIPLTEKELKLIDCINKNCKFLPEIADDRENRPFSSSLRRSIYFNNEKKEHFRNGSQLFINKVPDISAFLIKRLYKINIEGEKKAKKLLHPKILLKVYRGSRLACVVDFKGKIISTEKIINFFPNPFYQKYLFGLQTLLNSRIPSFFLQAILFNQTTETSRVLDPFYAAKIPVPDCSTEEFDLLDKMGKLIFLSKYQDNPKITALMVELAEIYSEFLYFREIYSDLIKNSSLNDISNLISNPILDNLFKITQIENFSEIYNNIIAAITHDLPISNNRIPNSFIDVNIWDDSLKKKINENIKRAFDYYNLSEFENTWIYRSLKIFLGK